MREHLPTEIEAGSAKIIRAPGGGFVALGRPSSEVGVAAGVVHRPLVVKRTGGTCQTL